MILNNLTNLFIERITGGLKRKSITDPARWAQAHRIMSQPYPGIWTFKYHPWLYELHTSTAELNIGQKAAQLGFTEAMLNIVFFKIDVEQTDCLYVLPAKTPDAGDFSTGRFDPALELCPHLQTLFSDVKNIGHKRAGSTNLYIRGSKSKAGLKSIPVGCIILDETDEFNQDNIELALERTSGQRIKLVWMISNPTIDLHGINKYYETSTKSLYHFQCPSCSRFIDLDFPDSLVITAESFDDPRLADSHLICKLCKNRLPHETKPEWLKAKQFGGSGIYVAEYPNRSIKGFHISQLYGMPNSVSPPEIAKSFLRAQQDPADEQNFYNNKLGITHIVEGARLTDHLIDRAKSSYLNGESRPAKPIITIGIDVGKHLHYEIDEWTIPYNPLDINIESRPRVLEIGKVLHFEELDLLMKKYRIISAVIDAHPERRKAFEFSQRFWGHVKMCFYGTGITGKQIHENKTDQEPTITVDRTSWLDLSLGRYRNSTITIPQNTPREYSQQLKALIRVYLKDKDGNPFGKYVHGNEADHYAHARNYAEIALPFAATLLNPQSIKSPMV